MRLLTNLVLLGFGLVGSALAKSVCCVPGCSLCMLEECHLGGCCTNIFFNTCCADDKKAVFFENEEEYLEAVAAGDIEG